MCFCRSSPSIVITLTQNITAIRFVLTVFAKYYGQQHPDGALRRTATRIAQPSGFSRWINHRGDGAGVPSDHLASGTMNVLNDCKGPLSKSKTGELGTLAPQSAPSIGGV